MKTYRQLMEETHAERVDLFKKLFSERLKFLRGEKNWSQKTISNKLGVAVSTYANWEQGRTEPSIYDIFNLIWVLEIDANELFCLDDIL